jgi:hypothetical protein
MNRILQARTIIATLVAAAVIPTFDASIPPGKYLVSLVSDGHEASRGFLEPAPQQDGGKAECVAQIEDVAPSRFRKVARWDAFGSG